MPTRSSTRSRPCRSRRPSQMIRRRRDSRRQDDRRARRRRSPSRPHATPWPQAPHDETVATVGTRTERPAARPPFPRARASGARRAGSAIAHVRRPSVTRAHDHDAASSPRLRGRGARCTSRSRRDPRLARRTVGWGSASIASLPLARGSVRAPAAAPAARTRRRRPRAWCSTSRSAGHEPVTRPARAQALAPWSRSRAARSCFPAPPK